MKKIIAFLTAAFISASSFSSFAAFAEAPETEPPTSVEPIYHQFRFDTPDALAAQLDTGFSGEVMSVLNERDGGVFSTFVESCQAAGLDVPMYGGRDIPFTHVSLFSRDLYGLPAVYYGVGNDDISHIIVQYPYDLTKPQPTIPLTAFDVMGDLYESSGYSGFDKLEKSDIHVCGSADAVVRRSSGGSRTWVSFLHNGVLVCVVLNTDDLSVLDGLSMDTRRLTKSDVSGDADNNGELTVADAVVFQRWLIGRGRMENPAVMDLHRDGRIDVYDFVVLKQRLVEDGCRDSYPTGGESERADDIYVDPVAPPVTTAPHAVTTAATTDKLGNTAGPAVNTTTAAVTTTPVQTAEPVAKNIVDVRSLAEFRALRGDLDLTDEEFEAAHSDVTRAELSETLGIMESLPIPVIEGAEIAWICRSVDPEAGSDVAYVTFTLPDGEFVRIEYVLSETNPEQAIFDDLSKNSDMTCWEGYVGDPDEDIKVYAELRRKKSDTFTEITWFVKYKFDLYVRAVYRCADPSDLNSEKLLGSVKLTTLK